MAAGSLAERHGTQLTATILFGGGSIVLLALSLLAGRAQQSIITAVALAGKACISATLEPRPCHDARSLLVPRHARSLLLE